MCLMDALNIRGSFKLEWRELPWKRDCSSADKKQKNKIKINSVLFLLLSGKFSP